MRNVLVRYRIRDDVISAHETLIHAVFDELRRTTPAGLRYHVHTLADGTSYVHQAEIDTVDASNPLAAMESFKRFQQGLRERCVEAPVAVDLHPVDGYEPPSQR
jgi:hypothetical protein